MKKTWLITGSARGMGRNLTEAALEEGHNVVATARNTNDLSDLVTKYPAQMLPVKLDVCNKDEIAAAVKTAAGHFGRIDVLVNNAGFGITGATEAFTDEQVNSQLAANLYGPIAITRAVIPYMRKQGSGRILQISSIGGRIGSCGISIYTAAKFGLTGFTEALNEELRPLNIFVTSIEPGGFRTDWGGTSMSFAPKVEGYENTADKRAEYFASGQFVPAGDPSKAAKVLIALSRHTNPPVHLVLGSQAINFLKEAESKRTAEMESWMDISLSTDI